MSSSNQDKRMIRTKCSLGDDIFVATALTGEEHISKLYRYQITLLSPRHDISQADIVGKQFSISIHYGKTARLIDGYVTHFSMHDVNAEGMRQYIAVVQPGLWFSNLSGKNRIFEKKSAIDIIDEVLSEHSSTLKFSKKLKGKYINREYCVQLNETDYEFVTRLMAQEGISYYFKHSENSHELVICDDHNDFYDCTPENVEYDGGGSNPRKNSVSSWHRDFNYHIGGFEFRDYNEFAAGKDNLQVVKTSSELNNISGYVQSRYGFNHFESEKDHQHTFVDSYQSSIAKRAIEAQESRFVLGQGRGDVPTMAAGGWFQFDHTLKSEQGKYLLTSVHLTATDSNSDDSTFRNTFTCIPEKITPRPDPFIGSSKILYPQVAKVISVKATESSGSKDPFTQVKVQFPWNSSQNSCWVRVVQSFSGKNWGSNFVPREGQEVVINYINGDPERPLVTGAVYNGDNTGPNYTATQSGWKTQFKNSQINELKFDDKPGDEKIYMEAGKDHSFLVHNDQSGKIDNNQTLEIKKNRTLTIAEGNETITLKKGDQSTTLNSGNQNISLKKGDQQVDIGGSQKISAKSTIQISSNTSIELKVAGNSIKISPSGITIKGTTLSCKGDASAEVAASGMLTLKGGITKIN